MQKFLVIAIILGVAYADDDAHSHVAKDYRKIDKHGNFAYGYDLTNGIGADESGDEHAVHGEYHYTSKDGVPVKVSYTADEHGYHPHSNVLPTPPPTPAAILKALKYLEAHPNKDDGHYHNARHDSHNDGHYNLHQNARHDSHRNVHHNVHQNVRHNSHRNVHQVTQHNAHYESHHGAHSARSVHHNSQHRGSHQNSHHGGHNNQHNNHRDNHHQQQHHGGHHH